MNKKNIKAFLATALAIGSVGSSIVFAEDNINVGMEENPAIMSRAVGKGQVKNVSKSLNIRKSASTSSEVVGKIPANGKFDIVSKSGSWYKVKYGSITGYVSGDYVKVISLPTTDSPSDNNSSSNASSIKNGKGQVINVSKTLNIRKSASTSSAVVGKLPANAKFDIVSKNGSWYKIKYGSVTGYVSGSYVKVITPPTTGSGNAGGNSGDNEINNGNTNGSTSKNGKGQVKNVSASLNIRKSASTSSAVVGKLPANAKFDIVSKSGSWYKIKYGNVTGYVSGDYVKVITPPTTGNGDAGGNSGGNEGDGENNNGSTSKNGKGQVKNVSTSLNIRKSASTSSAVVGKLPANAKFDIVSKSGSWYKIKYGSVTGYVSGDYVKVISLPTTEGSNGGNIEKPTEPSKPEEKPGDNDGEIKYGIVVGVSEGSTLRVRQSPNTTATVLGYLIPAQKVEIIGEEKNGWYKISYNSGIGYVGADFIKIINYDPDVPQDESTKAKFERVLAKMKTQLGSPYVYGGAGEIITKSLIEKLQTSYPNQSYLVPEEYFDKEWRAFDCSGLMYWGFKEAGITLGRSASSQINNGVEVNIDNIQPGDILFYKTLGHDGMYIGDGKWIESPRTGLNVRVTDVPWNLIGRARRVL